VYLVGPPPPDANSLLALAKRAFLGNDVATNCFDKQKNLNTSHRAGPPAWPRALGTLERGLETMPRRRAGLEPMW